MKKRILIMLAGLMILAGCSSNELSMGNRSVKYGFQNGIVKSSKKVLVSSTKVGAINGMLAGAIVGGFKKKKSKGILGGGLVGALVGAGIGAFQDVEAYETRILSKGHVHKAYLKKRLRAGMMVEFVRRKDKTVSNVHVVKNFRKKIKRHRKIKPKTRIIYKDRIIEKPRIVYKNVEKVVYKNPPKTTTVSIIEKKIVKRDDFWK
jgi:uncharacterized membrane protein YeaQ/YmgE (transglycosylase-associated protein family)